MKTVEFELDKHYSFIGDPIKMAGHNYRNNYDAIFKVIGKHGSYTKEEIEPKFIKIGGDSKGLVPLECMSAENLHKAFGIPADQLEEKLDEKTLRQMHIKSKVVQNAMQTHVDIVRHNQIVNVNRTTYIELHYPTITYEYKTKMMNDEKFWEELVGYKNEKA